MTSYTTVISESNDKEYYLITLPKKLVADAQWSEGDTIAISYALSGNSNGGITSLNLQKILQEPPE